MGTRFFRSALGWFIVLLLLLSVVSHAVHWVDTTKFPWLNNIALWSPIASAVLFTILYFWAGSLESHVQKMVTSAEERTSGAVQAAETKIAVAVHTAEGSVSSLRETDEKAAGAARRLQLEVDRLDEMAQNQKSVLELMIQHALREGEHIRAEMQTMQDVLFGKDLPAKARLFFLEGRFADAAEVYAEILRDEPRRSDPELNYRMWKCLAELGRTDEAHSYEERAKEWIEHHEASDFAVLGDLNFSEQKFDAAEANYRKAIEQGAPNRPMLLLKLGKSIMKTKPAEAIVVLEEALETIPHNANAVSWLAKLYRDRREYDKAIAACDRLLNENPEKYPMVLVARAESCLGRNREGDWLRAENDLSLALEKNKKDFNIYRVLGHLYLRQSLQEESASRRAARVERLIAVCQMGLDEVAASAAHPHTKGALYSQLYNMMSEGFVISGDREKAVEVASKSVTTNVNHIDNHLALIEALVYDGRWLRAAGAARTARNIGGGKAGAAYCLVYELLASLCASHEVPDLKELLVELVARLREFTFKPERPLWQEIRRPVMDATNRMPQKERELLNTLISILDASKHQTTLIADLEATLAVA